MSYHYVKTAYAHDMFYVKKLNFFSKNTPIRGTGFVTSFDALIIPKTSRINGIREMREKRRDNAGTTDTKMPEMIEIMTLKINTPRLCSK